jgi:hypothetical protein
VEAIVLAVMGNVISSCSCELTTSTSSITSSRSSSCCSKS